MAPKDYAKWAVTIVAVVALAVLLGMHKIDWPAFMAGLGLLLSPSVLQGTGIPPAPPRDPKPLDPKEVQ